MHASDVVGKERIEILWFRSFSYASLPSLFILHETCIDLGGALRRLSHCHGVCYCDRESELRREAVLTWQDETASLYAIDVSFQIRLA